jgi:4-hydroxythreonine-4-phosphate dehydrogenase
MSMPAPGELPLAVSMGEPAGFSGEITLKAWLRRSDGLPPFFAIDDPARLEAAASRLGVRTPIRPIHEASEAGKVFADALPVLPLHLAEPAVPGKLSAANQLMVRQAIETGARLSMAGKAGGLVTNPIQKQALYGSGFSFPGHTEFLAALGGVERSVMMLACPQLRVVPVTVHVSLAEALSSLTTDLIVETAVITANALRRDFGLARPRLAVAGLNPHAGEEGSLGLEDGTIVRPAVAELRQRGIDAFGPVPPDSLFTERARADYDVAICMYHDQALIPIKALDVEGAVNVTLGIPFVRTSPDHGTALDIAGTGKASEASLVAALRMAQAMAVVRGAPQPA